MRRGTSQLDASRRRVVLATAGLCGVAGCMELEDPETDDGSDYPRPEFTLVETDVPTTSVAYLDPLTVSGTVENIGELRGNTEVRVSIAGTTESTLLTIEGDESESFDVDLDSAAFGLGEFPVAVSVEDEREILDEEVSVTADTISLSFDDGESYDSGESGFELIHLTVEDADGEVLLEFEPEGEALDGDYRDGEVTFLDGTYDPFYHESAGRYHMRLGPPAEPTRFVLPESVFEEAVRLVLDGHHPTDNEVSVSRNDAETDHASIESGRNDVVLSLTE